MRFGYIRGEKFNLLTEMGSGDWKEAIMRLQKFARIPETGLIDRQTLQLLKRKRCGIPDITYNQLESIHDERHRFKRYALQGSKWPRNNITWRLVTLKLLSLQYFSFRVRFLRH